MSKQKPLIGVFGQIALQQDYMQPGYRRLALNEDYVRVIHEAGGIPFVITPLEDHRGLEEQVKLCDGLFFTGGDDLHPQMYGEEALPQLGELDTNRDAFERLGLDLALKYRKPCLGVCRGMQLINVYFGGSLYQDIYSQLPDSQMHNQKGHIGMGIHQVIISPDSFLSRALGREKIMTNSHHHQAIKELAAGFKVVATAADGCIEAIERKETPFIAGVQWHPEMMIGYSDRNQLAIFSHFVNCCRN